MEFFFFLINNFVSQLAASFQLSWLKKKKKKKEKRAQVIPDLVR